MYIYIHFRNIYSTSYQYTWYFHAGWVCACMYVNLSARTKPDFVRALISTYISMPACLSYLILFYLITSFIRLSGNKRQAGRQNVATTPPPPPRARVYIWCRVKVHTVVICISYHIHSRVVIRQSNFDIHSMARDSVASRRMTSQLN